jgi:hypothetical protein
MNEVNELVRRVISLMPVELLRLMAGSAEVRAAVGQTAQLSPATLRAIQLDAAMLFPDVRDAIARIEYGASDIRLVGVRIDNRDARALATALANSATLTRLELVRSNIGVEGAQALAAALRNNATLTVLVLDRNNIGDQGAQALAAALMNNATLTVLNLDLNNIGDAGAQALAAALRNNATLTDLMLGYNNIDDEGARALAAALHDNATLTDLNLRVTNIGDEGAQALAAALHDNATLTSLHLGDNYIGDEGARALAAALRNNATLTSLGLRRNNIGDEGAQALAAALVTNRTLQHLLCMFVDNELDAVKDDRLRLNQIIAQSRVGARTSMPEWVASVVARLWDPKFRIPPGLAARAAMLAFGEAMLPADGWRSPGGRKFAADYLMPRAEDALQAELARGLL